MISQPIPVDWARPLQLTDGTPVSLKRGVQQPDDFNRYCIIRDDCRPFTVTQVMERPLVMEFVCDPGGREYVPGTTAQLAVVNRLGSPPTTGSAITKEPTETLRDRFAMAALTGLLAADASPLAFSLASRHAWLMADKMMAERGS